MSEQELVEALQATDIAATPGEGIFRKGRANLWRDAEAVGGHLWLTRKWLVFRSRFLNIQAGVWAWPRDEIVSTRPVNTFGIVPNGMELVLRSDERMRFVVTKRRNRMSAIAEAQGRTLDRRDSERRWRVRRLTYGALIRRPFS
ncbi:GRAM domain-containing protein [Nonomuraea sp. NPDC059023]|uniref:GRAM domain-containing protein n=1 Tax=unclassified Nonomuraea TaxID=2593643 RepID=UPI0036AE8199